MLKSIILGQIRHALTAVGGLLIAPGIVSAADWTTVVAASMIVIGAGWSWFDKSA